MAEDLKAGMISTFPPPGEKHAAGMGGVASYTQNLVENLSGLVDSLTVFSNNEGYEEEDYKVVESWKKGILYPLTNWLNIRDQDEDFDIIHIQHEMFLYGGALSAAVFPLLALLLRLSRKKVIVTLHNGLISKEKIDTGFCQRHGMPEFPRLWRTGLHLYFRSIGLASNELIVHEEKFEQILEDDYGLPGEKLNVIPHGVEEVENKEPIETEVPVILFFGYIAPYKGVETLIEVEEHLDFAHRTIIAGGKHPDADEGNVYEEYYQEIKEKAENHDNIEMTGFVKEEEIGEYFRKADVVVLPYKDVFSSSGPLHLALAYQTMVIGSEDFNEVFFPDRDQAELISELQGLGRFNGLNQEKNIQLPSWSFISRKTFNLYKEISELEVGKYGG
ncbi:MAG: glycosyltransferase [Candidatus Aenigmatarchaeota archaeon]